MTRTGLKVWVCGLAVAGAVLAGGTVSTITAQDDLVPAAVDRPETLSQDKPAPKPAIPLKVTVIIARYQGEKRTGSLPFVLTVNTGGRTSLQMGAQVPYPASEAGTSYAYKTIGTNINLSASAHDDGRFSLDLTVTDSQIFADPVGGSAALKGIPSFQNFTSQSTLYLRDGQTLQYSTAVDKSSGEVIKLDVTLNVIK